MKLAKAAAFLFLALSAAAQSSKHLNPATPGASPEAGPDIADVPVRILDFKLIEDAPVVSLSAVTAIPAQCTADGTLYLDMLDIHDPKKHSLVSVNGKTAHTFPLSAISDLHDITVHSYFPSTKVVGILVRGTKELPGTPGPDKSPAGVAWRDYHNYVAEFDPDGSYQKSVQLPMAFQLSHLAILPSGEMLVSGYDQLNSTARLLFLDDSGNVARQLDLPAFQKPVAADSSYGSHQSMMESSQLMGSVLFTAYDQDILVWRMGSSDPILDVGPGGSTREVPIQPPSGMVFTSLIPSTDRWVALFRQSQAPANQPLTPATYSWYDLRPQDASPASKLAPAGEAPASIACEVNGSYIAFKPDKNGKLMLVKAD